MIAAMVCLSEAYIVTTGLHDSTSLGPPPDLCNVAMKAPASHFTMARRPHLALHQPNQNAVRRFCLDQYPTTRIMSLRTARSLDFSFFLG